MNPNPSGMRRPCRVCKQWLAVEMFSTNGARGRRGECRPCASQITAERRKRNQHSASDRDRAIYRARTKAERRLRRMTPELFERVYSEELEKEGLELTPRMRTWIYDA